MLANRLEELVARYRALGIDNQIDYENQILFDQRVSLKGKSIEELQMNLDLKAAYEKAIEYAKNHTPISVELLIRLSSLVMKNTGKEYKTALGDFSSARGELRLLNVTAVVGGRSYMNYSKVPQKLVKFCKQVNAARANAATKTIDELYQLTFDAHYQLVTIHPWADGNGRMARLVMNMLQFEFGLIPAKIIKEDKEEYIKALVATREEDDRNIFREFMSSMMIRHLTQEMDAYLQSINSED